MSEGGGRGASDTSLAKCFPSVKCYRTLWMARRGLWKIETIVSFMHEPPCDSHVQRIFHCHLSKTKVVASPQQGVPRCKDREASAS